VSGALGGGAMGQRCRGPDSLDNGIDHSAPLPIASVSKRDVDPVSRLRLTFAYRRRRGSIRAHGLTPCDRLIQLPALCGLI